MKFLCDVIFSALPGQCNNSYFEIAIFHLDDYHWQQNFSYHTYKSLTTSKSISENFTLKLRCDVIFPSSSGQCDIPSFKMANFQLDDYYWWPNFYHHTKLKKPKTLTTSKDISENFTLKLLSDVIFPSLFGQPNIHRFTMSNFRTDEYQWNGSRTSQITSNSSWKPLTGSKKLSENLTLKLLFDVIFPVLPSKCDIPSSKIANF